MLFIHKYLWSGYTGSAASLGAGNKMVSKEKPEFPSFQSSGEKSLKLM